MAALFFLALAELALDAGRVARLAVDFLALAFADIAALFFAVPFFALLVMGGAGKSSGSDSLRGGKGEACA